MTSDREPTAETPQPTETKPQPGSQPVLAAERRGIMPPRAQAFVREVAAEHLIWPIVLLMVIVGATVPGFLTSGNIDNLVWGAAPLGCMVVGVYFVMITGRLDLSLESTYALAPTIAVLFMTKWWIGIPTRSPSSSRSSSGRWSGSPTGSSPSPWASTRSSSPSRRCSSCAASSSTSSPKASTTSRAGTPRSAGSGSVGPYRSPCSSSLASSPSRGPSCDTRPSAQPHRHRQQRAGVPRRRHQRSAHGDRRLRHSRHECRLRRPPLRRAAVLRRRLDG